MLLGQNEHIFLCSMVHAQSAVSLSHVPASVHMKSGSNICIGVETFGGLRSPEVQDQEGPANMSLLTGKRLALR